MIKKMRLKVEGMFCAHCSKTVSDIFDKVGIKANVNLAKNEVIFNYDDEKISLEYLKRLVKKAGYTLVVDNGKKKFNFPLFSLIVSAVILVISLVSMIGHMGIHNDFFHFLNNEYLQLSLASIAILVLGIPFAIRAIKEVKFKKFGMDFLISFASFIAYALSIYCLIRGIDNHFHAVCMILSVISIGHFISDKLKSLNGKQEASLENYVTKTAHLKVKEDYVDTDVDEIEEGDLVKVLSGEFFPVDGIIVEGQTNVDEKILTGESRVREVKSDSLVYASSTNTGNPVIVKATKNALDSLFTNIVNESYVLDNSRGKMNKLSDKIASIFVPFVILVALVAFLIHFFGFHQSVEESIVDAVAVLVVSCPCAFGLAVPLASLNGYYLALKNGIVFKTGDTFERVKSINKIFFDKTGTLTKGELVIVASYGSKELYPIVKGLEENSTHPLARSIIKAMEGVESQEFKDVVEEKGLGLKSGKYKLGSYKYMSDSTFSPELESFKDQHNDKTIIYLSVDSVVELALVLEDEVKTDAYETIRKLQEANIETYMLTGDAKGYADSVGKELGFAPDHIFSEVNPSEKGETIKNSRKPGDCICYIGDGINDLLALQQSDLAIASYMASDIASDKAEVKLLKDSLLLIPLTVKLSRHVYFNILENFIWAFLYNACMIPLAVMGLLSPTLSSALMIASNITLILNSLRIRLWKGGKKWKLK